MNKVLFPYIGCINQQAEGCLAEINGKIVYIHKIRYLKKNILIVYTLVNHPPVWRFTRIPQTEPVMFFKAD